MDVLSSLNLNDLPEQQTRTSHPGVSQLLSESSKCNGGTGDNDVRIGFNVCCNCAKKHVTVLCKGCKRVRYCSIECRRADAQSSKFYNDENNDPAMGHTSLVCAMLQTCEHDDIVEGDSSDDYDGEKRKMSLSTGLIEAAEDRIRSEYESYPATLANILMEGPCYQSIILSKKKTKRSSSKDTDETLTIHVVGASEEAELWGNYSNEHDVYDSYAEALLELALTNKIPSIRIMFIGPSCPKKNVTKKKFLTEQGVVSRIHNNDNYCELILETHCCDYHHYSCASQNPKKGKISAPDFVIFFNPGFTCPDYDWAESLRKSNITDQTPFLVTTNTEMEGISDCKFLQSHNFITRLPHEIEYIINESNDDDNFEDRMDDMFFSENPYAGSRVRQSGNMANDLFVKSRWMLGGIWSSAKSFKDPSDVDYQKNKKRKLKTKNNDDDTDINSDSKIKRCDKKVKRVEGKKQKAKESGKLKRKNPGLM